MIEYLSLRNKILTHFFCYIRSRTCDVLYFINMCTLRKMFYSSFIIFFTAVRASSYFSQNKFTHTRVHTHIIPLSFFLIFFLFSFFLNSHPANFTRTFSSYNSYSFFSICQYLCTLTAFNCKIRVIRQS